MAEDKKSIIVYADWKNIFEELSDDEAGKLIKHFFRYVNDINPEPPDRLTKLLFEPIKQTLKRDLVKHEDKREKNRQNALIRWNKENAVASERIKIDANHADSDSDSDSDTVNDTDTVIVNEDKRKANKSPDFIDQILDCFIQEHGSYEIINRGKERAAISKILSQYKKKYPAATSDETIEGLRQYFKLCINIPDVWLKNNMSPSIIVSKFNEINKIIKNGTTGKSNRADGERTNDYWNQQN
jgi:hypothetical protein